MYYFHSINGIELKGVGIFDGESFCVKNIIKDLQTLQASGKKCITGKELCDVLSCVNR